MDESDFFNKMDWNLLQKQKAELLNRIDNSDILMGVVHLIDSIQDHAVDMLGYDENEVFTLEKE